MGATPAVAQFLGFASRTNGRLYLIGTPFAIFTVGLICAIFCALGSYYNYLCLAEVSQARQELELLQQEVALPAARREDRERVRKEWTERLTRDIGRREKIIPITFYCSHIFGWLSLVAFMCACVFLAAHV
jgi:hypothetical protein